MEFLTMVKQVRIQLNLSQKQLADALSVCYATINRWENGHVVPSKLAQKSFYDFCENNLTPHIGTCVERTEYTDHDDQNR